MHNLVLIFFILVTITSCKEDKCEIDSKLNLEFNNNLDLIKRFEHGTTVGMTNYLNAISYMSKLTGHESQLYIGGSIGYRGDSIKFHQDLTKWKEWYDLNKCSITNAKADSILGDYIVYSPSD